VAPTGRDAATGTEAAPLRTLGAAAALAARLHASAVVLRAGKYFINATLELTLEHTGLRLAAYQGEHVTVSGGAPLQLQWTKHQGSVMKARVSLPALLSDAERDHLAQRAQASRSYNASAQHNWGPPPAKWNTMFVDGVRQVRNCQGETDRGFRGLTRTPWASSYAPPSRIYGVF
jgi:hypothetical protein